MQLGDLQLLQSLLAENRWSSVFILTDENTNKHCLTSLMMCIDFPVNPEILEVEPGENSKSIEICHQLWWALNDLGADRNSLLINLGGGMITDLGGFLASTFQRGIDFIQIPTTLLAMTDAAIGGKTGINLGNLKNQIGTFQNPVAVILDQAWLETLPSREIRSGFAEVVKHGIIADNSLLKACFETDVSNQEEVFQLLEPSLKVKADIIAIDPFEKKERKFLNFGHTGGHALESLTLNDEDPLLHGECVAWGMMIATLLSIDGGGLEAEAAKELIRSIDSYYPDIQPEVEIEKMWEVMLRDKKNRNGKVNFVLLSKVSKPIANVEISMEHFAKACDDLRVMREEL
ncbi:MAG: 3-dehydroquinate synthase [Cryomorphaceae bacterium]|nr:3-dehydroquinate synthase [Cryomorphaceae bacterium]